MRDHPDLAALAGFERREALVLVGVELVDVTRAALLGGTMTLAIAQPLDRMADELIQAMTGACLSRTAGRNWTRVLPFELFNRENI